MPLSLNGLSIRESKRVRSLLEGYRRRLVEFREDPPRKAEELVEAFKQLGTKQERNELKRGSRSPFVQLYDEVRSQVDRFYRTHRETGRVVAVLIDLIAGLIIANDAHRAHQEGKASVVE